MCDLRRLGHDFLTDFIKLYKRNACLWKKDNPDYSNQKKRDASYQILLKQLRLVDPDAVVESVKIRINSLRCNFRKELGKVRKAKAAGLTYTPLLWYYELLKFLLTDEEREKLGEPPEQFEDENCDDDVDDVIEFVRNSDHEDNIGQNDFSADECLPNAAATKWDQIDATTQEINVQEVIEGDQLTNEEDSLVQTELILLIDDNHVNLSPVPKKRKICNESTQTNQNWLSLEDAAAPSDDFEQYGMELANKLRCITKNQNIHAIKLINDILFEAEMKTLSETVQIAHCESTEQIEEYL